MSNLYIIDAHAHTGSMNLFFAPEYTAGDLVARMDRLSIQCSINAGGWAYLMHGGKQGLTALQREFGESKRSIFNLGVYDPRRGGACLEHLGIQPRAGFVYSGALREVCAEVSGSALRSGPFRGARQRAV